jgi:hypothetical protein
MLGAFRLKRRRLSEKLEDRESKVLSSLKSAFKGRFKNPLGHTFINMLVMHFDLYLTDSVKIAAVFSGFLSRRSTLVNSA